MTDYLFATLDGGGNVPVVAAVAGELRARGHGVRVLSHPAQGEVMRAAGVDFETYAHAHAWDPRAPKSSVRGLPEMFRVATDRGIADDVVAAIRRGRPDVVVVDCMLLGVSSRLHRLGIPHATLFHTLYRWWDHDFRYGPIGWLSRATRVGDPRRLWEDSNLRLVCTDPILDRPRRAAGGSIEWVGPVHDATAAASPSAQTRVLVSLSTVGYPGLAATLQKVLDACAAVPAEFVVTTGPAVDPTALRAPSNCVVHRYVSHAELMPGCTAVIAHGGHSTTMRALAHGLPVLSVPMHPLIDQPTVARAVVEAGAGLVVDRRTKVAGLRAAVTELVDEKRYGVAARMLGERLRATDAGSVAADRLEALA